MNRKQTVFTIFTKDSHKISQKHLVLYHLPGKTLDVASSLDPNILFDTTCQMLRGSQKERKSGFSAQCGSV